MARTKAISISRPFDARHVAGVDIQGTSVPIPDIPKTFSSTLEPDEVPTHMNMSLNAQAPKRSNTTAHTLSRPSLRLKTSISRLRGRSSSNSPDTYRKKGRGNTPEPRTTSEQPPQLPEIERLVLSRPTLEKRPSQRPEFGRSISSATLMENRPALEKRPSQLPPLEILGSSRVVAEKRPAPPTRPKRADSGTAIDFDDVPVDERPLGFKEIVAVKSFDERMALYKRTRDYWASADHGLEEWIGSVGVRRPLVAQV